MKHKKETRQVLALARRKVNVQQYTKMLNSPPEEKLFLDGEEVERKVIMDKLKQAEKEVTILQERVGPKFSKEEE